MKVGCYTLDLYCSIYWGERAEIQERGVVPSCGWRKNMQQFTGRTEAECLREAKAAGWFVSKTKDLCPKHNQERRRKGTGW